MRKMLELENENSFLCEKLINGEWKEAPKMRGVRMGQELWRISTSVYSAQLDHHGFVWITIRCHLNVSGVKIPTQAQVTLCNLYVTH